MKHRILQCLSAVLLLSAAAVQSRERLTVPDVPVGEPRFITADDYARLRRIEVLSLSPDGARFAILVRQGDPNINNYRRAWFMGSVQGGQLKFIGDGGDTRLVRGSHDGSLERPTVRWSPDGRWIAYTLLRDGAIQIWRSRADGGQQEQITRNAADVQEFEWSEDGRSIYYTVGTPRVQQEEMLRARERAGYQYDEELITFADFMLPHMPLMEKSVRTIWTVAIRGRQERLANAAEQAAFIVAQGRGDPTRGDVGGAIYSGVTVQTMHSSGALAWLVPSKEDASALRISASLSGEPSDAIECVAAECTGFIERIWWIDGRTVLFWRREGINLASAGFYTWAPPSDVVQTVLRLPDDMTFQCGLAFDRHLICMRETATLPSHVASIDATTGHLQVIADVNPEFRKIRLGRVERIEWDTPKFSWSELGEPLHGLYSERAYGYIYYPPDFDPEKKYPLYINPYAADGFDNITNQELPNHLFAARGIVVLSTSFPILASNVFKGPGVDLLKLIYSPELDFPHLSLYGESTLRAVDSLIAHGFIDDGRIGMGGVSTGTLVSLFILQRYDRLAAVSILSGAWSRLEYYLPTGRVRRSGGATVWAVKPEGAGMELWRRLDLADNVETIEAPILMNVPANEMPTLIRLVTHMAEIGKPYDAYVFSDETHIKWQPAHIDTVIRRNVDWFDFWLMDREDPDPDPAKASQYARWRHLKKLRRTENAAKSSMDQSALRSQVECAR
jgi:dipeptidyl aminopeptidase/acylaminoacyl peptidase